jgi:hypothetical protein
MSMDSNCRARDRAVGRSALSANSMPSMDGAVTQAPLQRHLTEETRSTGRAIRDARLLERSDAPPAVDVA